MISYILIIISAVAKAIMDVISEGKWSGWWNKSESWILSDKIETLKWKDGDPEKGERFFGSSTFLVWLTDGWHLFQAIFLNCLFVGLLLHDGWFNWFYDFLIIAVAYGIIFEISYRLIKKL